MDSVIPRSTTAILARHAGIGKRRLASCIRSEIMPHPAPAIATGATTSDALGPIPPSNTDVYFRTAEELPLLILGPGSSQGASTLSLPLLRAFSDEVEPSNLPSTSTLTPTMASALKKNRDEDVAVVDSVARYDLILFLIDMTNRTSWEQTKTSVMQLDPAWFLGHCAFVVTRVAAVSKYAFERDDITDFIEEFYDIPTVWTNLDNDSEAALAGFQLVRILEVGAGYRRIRSPSELNTYSLMGQRKQQPQRQALSEYPKSTLGDRLTATHLLMRSPDKYQVRMTTIPMTFDHDSHEEEEEEVSAGNEEGNADEQA
ncbi:hypothetical protein BGZ99_008697 [Dissophora globulifera]|uniref:Centromere protein M n=1 Tax=Dissophora globulifera TaxID=979702 RepID=A0A9P6UYX3_9FUNG|nr:hypothetical protein BGZ99_008697 [Dissophora globulifera]